MPDYKLFLPDFEKCYHSALCDAGRWRPCKILVGSRPRRGKTQRHKESSTSRSEEAKCGRDQEREGFLFRRRRGEGATTIIQGPQKDPYRGLYPPHSFISEEIGSKEVLLAIRETWCTMNNHIKVPVGVVATERVE